MAQMGKMKQAVVQNNWSQNYAAGMSKTSELIIFSVQLCSVSYTVFIFRFVVISICISDSVIPLLSLQPKNTFATRKT